MKLITRIKRAYPYPVPASGAHLTCSGTVYCIGGALEAYRSGTSHPDWQPFPRASRLAAVLQAYNPQLTPGVAQEYAELIISANDDGRFTMAWRYAECALAYDPDLED